MPLLVSEMKSVHFLFLTRISFFSLNKNNFPVVHQRLRDFAGVHTFRAVRRISDVPQQKQREPLGQVLSVCRNVQTFPGIANRFSCYIRTQEYYIHIYMLSQKQLLIEAETSRGFIAIDDIGLTPGLCQGTAILCFFVAFPFFLVKQVTENILFSFWHS